VINRQLRKALLACGAVVVLGSAIPLVLASRRIAAEQAAYHAPASGRCVPSLLNASAVLPGTSLSVTPLPGTYAASPNTQISLLGVPGGELHAVRVSGSLTGPHAGRLAAYSQGDGASFIPRASFEPGELVTVRGNIRKGKRVKPFAFSFTVAHDDTVPVLPQPAPARRPGEVQHFHSRHDLVAPALEVSASVAGAGPARARAADRSSAGLVFATPYAGPSVAGPMIFDEAGNLVWFSPLARGIAAENLQVQQLDGEPVLTYWRGRIPAQGFGEGEEVILDDSYRQIGRVRAGNGYEVDLHDFHVGARDTAVFTVFNPIECDLSAVGGPRGSDVTDGAFQEVDTRTGLVRREWHSIDHVALTDSYQTPVTASSTWPFDYFHINSVVERADGITLVSARNTSAIYELDTATGQVLETIGGHASSIRLGPGASTAYQHDARVLPNGTISIFDNGGVPMLHAQSRGVIIKLNRHAGTGAVVAQYEHPKPLSSGSQGNFQQLPDGNFFVGWGSEPYFSEFTPAGRTVFDAHFRGPYQSYRGYRYSWVGAPAEPPAIAVRSPHTGVATVYASWNGDTRTTRWRLLAGSSPRALSPVAAAPREGFETAITLPVYARYVAVQALDATGAVIGRSRAARR
jgi:hypothetical protein